MKFWNIFFLALFTVMTVSAQKEGITLVSDNKFQALKFKDEDNCEISLKGNVHVKDTKKR